MHFFVNNFDNHKPVRVTLVRRGAASVFYCRFSLRSKDYFLCTGATIDGQARKFARDAVIEAVGATDTNSLMLSAAITEYLNSRWPEQGRSFISAEQRLRKWEAHENLDLAKVDGDTLTNKINAYLTHCAKTVQAQTIRGYQEAISSLCAWLLRTKRDVIQWRHNPASRKLLSLPPVPPKVHPEVPQSALDVLLREGRKYEIWPVIVLCVAAGMRPRGAILLPWSAIDLDGLSITVTEKGRPRQIPLADWVCDALREWRQAHPADEKVYSLNLYTAFDQMARLRESAGLPSSVTLQALRRVAANRLIDTAEPRVYSMIMGHSLKVAERHYLARKSSKAHAAVNEAFDYSKTPSKTPSKESTPNP